MDFWANILTESNIITISSHDFGRMCNDVNYRSECAKKLGMEVLGSFAFKDTWPSTDWTVPQGIVPLNTRFSSYKITQKWK